VPERLEEFWRRMRRKEFWGLANWPGLGDTTSYWSTVLGGIPGFFEPNPLAFFGAHYPLGRDKAGFYSTAPLEKTLSELVDFSLIARCTPRLTVGAAHVRTSKMHYFDSRETAITARHIMASGALPPAFPAVRIDGELYWDGGILSNTPTEAIFDDNPRRNSLIFAVHMCRSPRRSGTCSTGTRTSSTRAVSRVTSRDKARFTSCATSFPNWSN
jgi:NTE family protein